MMNLSVITDRQVQKIHEQTIKIFEQVGIKVTHDEALNKLKQAGAKIDESSQIAKLPAELITELLAQAPAIAQVTSLNGKILNVGKKNRYFNSLILDPFIYDYNDGIRLPQLEDVRRHTIIGESLSRISGMMRMQMSISDIPDPDCYLKTMEVFLCHITKHVSIYPTSVENCRQWMDVYEVIADAAGLDLNTTPLISVAMAVTSPLQIHGMNIEIMKMAMQRCFPVVSTVCPMAGTTSPCSIAGTALLSNVEALAPVLLTQVYKPGHPCFYGFGASATNLKSGHDLYYKAEKMLWKAICCKMGKFYGLPVSGGTGGSLTHLPDLQNGAESFALMFASILGGQNWFGGVGSMGNANGMSAEQIIMQCGLIDMVEFLEKGVDTCNKKLAFDSIASIGPSGNYLLDELTLELMHSNEFFSSPYLDMSGGYHKSKGTYEIAHETAQTLVNNYKQTVPDAVYTAIKKFFLDRYSDKKVADL